MKVESGGKVITRHIAPPGGGSSVSGTDGSPSGRVRIEGAWSVAQYRVETYPGRDRSTVALGGIPSIRARDFPSSSKTTILRFRGGRLLIRLAPLRILRQSSR